MPSQAVAAFQQAIKSCARRPDPDLKMVSHCVADALALTPEELEQVVSGVRAAIAAGKFKVSVPYDASGKIDETKLPAMPKLPPASVRPAKPGKRASERRVQRMVATCATLTPKELTLVTQGVRAGRAARGW